MPFLPSMLAYGAAVLGAKWQFVMMGSEYEPILRAFLLTFKKGSTN